MSTGDSAEDYINRAMQMTLDLQKIAKHYFHKVQLGSPNATRFMEIEQQFQTGCEQMKTLLRALKNKLLYNRCFCNTLRSC